MNCIAVGGVNSIPLPSWYPLNARNDTLVYVYLINIRIDFFKTGTSKMLLCKYVTDIIGNDFIKNCVPKVKIEYLLGTFALV